MDRNEIREMVLDYVGEYAGDFDLEGIVSELACVADPDGMDPDEFRDLVASHDLTA